MSPAREAAAQPPAPGPPRPPDAPEDAAAPRAATRTRGTAAVLAAALLLLLAAAVLYHQERMLSGSPTAANRALTDGAATDRVAAEVGAALREVFSYRPEDTGRTRAAAADLLDGRAARQYTGLFARVEQEAARQKLTLTTHVVRAGVTRLDGGRARLLVFLDQVAERPGRAASTVPAQLSVTARLEAGRWRITDIAAR
ncbi:hypothetical protein NPS70_00120 [Streptomyces sp. C10-9-1]|uniref:hypothetical protein n=1 Tax=Streptomyces sp. C10-9-1 TaxID=1859285 RepID=UPI0021134FF3|nr:hypothetical protein [Streptomyces sp. C10-9-1]MCQ6551613.1 hypothetical protein [Streptomyces sp. C10-9-1]